MIISIERVTAVYITNIVEILLFLINFIEYPHYIWIYSRISICLGVLFDDCRKTKKMTATMVSDGQRAIKKMKNEK